MNFLLVVTFSYYQLRIRVLNAGITMRYVSQHKLLNSLPGARIGAILGFDLLTADKLLDRTGSILDFVVGEIMSLAILFKGGGEDPYVLI